MNRDHNGNDPETDRTQALDSIARTKERKLEVNDR